jgi:hypothetical protein
VYEANGERCFKVWVHRGYTRGRKAPLFSPRLYTPLSQISPHRDFETTGYIYSNI